MLPRVEAPPPQIWSSTSDNVLSVGAAALPPLFALMVRAAIFASFALVTLELRIFTVVTASEASLAAVTVPSRSAADQSVIVIAVEPSVPPLLFVQINVRSALFVPSSTGTAIETISSQLSASVERAQAPEAAT